MVEPQIISFLDKVIKFRFFSIPPASKLIPKCLLARASWKKVFWGLFLRTTVTILLLNERVPEKDGISGKNVMDDFEMKDCKSSVFSDFERNAVDSKLSSLHTHYHIAID